MHKVNVKSMDKLQQLVKTQAHTLVSDEPPGLGDGFGPNPFELLLAALGSCTAMTIRLYADRKGWPVESVDVELTHERVRARDCADSDEEGDVMVDLIRRTIVVAGQLDEAQGSRLREIAERCPVHRALQGGPTIVTNLDVVKE